MNTKYKGYRNNKTIYWKSITAFFVFTLVSISLSSKVLAATNYTITTVAGNGTQGFSGDGGSAIAASFNGPKGLAVDSQGNIFVADTSNGKMRRVDHATGIISTVASSLAGPDGTVTNAQGDVFVADMFHNVIKKIDHSTGSVSIFAGTGISGYKGDGGKANTALLNIPNGLGIDSNGNIYISDYGNCRIRKVNYTTNIITTVAGNNICGYNGDNILATQASLAGSSQIDVDNQDNIFFIGNTRIRRIDHSTNIITTVAGNGNVGFNGDNKLATQASLNQPSGLQVDSQGNLFISDTVNWRIRKVDYNTKIITTIAGNGTRGYGGDGKPAVLTSLDYAGGLALDDAGNIFVADGGNSRVRKLIPSPSYDLTTQSTLNLDFAATHYDAKNSQIVELKNSTANPITVSNIIISDASNYWVNLFTDKKKVCRAKHYTANSKNFTIPANSSCTIAIGFSPFDDLTAAKSIPAILTLKTLINGIATDKVINLTGIGRAQIANYYNNNPLLLGKDTWGVSELKGGNAPINTSLVGASSGYSSAKYWYGGVINPKLQKATASIGDLVVFAQNSIDNAGHVGVIIQTTPVLTMLSMNDVKDQQGIKMRKWSVRPVDFYPSNTVTWSPLITGFNTNDATKHYGFISWRNSLY